MTYEIWPCKALRHYVSQLPVGINIREVENVFLAPVSDNVVANVDMFGPFRRHIVGGHVNAGLIILMEKDWFSDTDAEFLKESAQPYHRVACVSDRAVLRSCSGLRRCARLQFTAEVYQVSIEV